MEREKIKEIETQKPEELWDKFDDLDSPENVVHAFKDALSKLVNEPNLYYLETDDKKMFAIVRKRVDDSMIYETDVPSEVEGLKEVGVEK